MALLLGIDLGTSYFKAGLFDLNGNLRGLGRIAVPVAQPTPDRVELNVSSFWQSVRACVQAAITQAGASADSIAGISYASQANTFLMLDREDRPLTPLIVWNDRRVVALRPELVEFGDSTQHREKTGLVGVVDGGMPVKCDWFAHEEPALWQRCSSVMTISDYLTFSLTGERAGDASTTALTGLYDLSTRALWPQALAAFGLENRKFCEPLRPGLACGHLNKAAQELLVLPAGIPFAVGALDHHAAAIGVGVDQKVGASLSLGTVLAALVLVDEVAPALGVIHGPHSDGRRLYRLAFDAEGASLLETYQRRNAPSIRIASLLESAEESRKGTQSSDVNPHGAAVHHIVEQSGEKAGVLLARIAPSAPPQLVAATGGGARSLFWLKTTADKIGIPVAAPAHSEPACLGAAIFAGLAAKSFQNIESAVNAMCRTGPILTPDASSPR